MQKSRILIGKQAHFRRLLDALRAEFHPESDIESQLVESIAMARHRQPHFGELPKNRQAKPAAKNIAIKPGNSLKTNLQARKTIPGTIPARTQQNPATTRRWVRRGVENPLGGPSSPTSKPAGPA